MPIQPFTVDWSESEIDRVIHRVADTRLPPAPAGSGWSLGCDADFLARMRDHWVRNYDLRAAIAALNRYPQCTASIDGQEIHFVHVRGENPGARPLIMTHGWPGSHFEFWRVIERLAFPSRHGGKAGDAFELVVPSLPGFGFSAKAIKPTGPFETARLWDLLMTRELGFPAYLAQGGDWGAYVATCLGADPDASVKAIHLNMLCLLQSDPPATKEEEVWLSAYRKGQRLLGDYMRLQSRKPQSIAWAAADNPLGQASWIVERFHDWSDLNGRELDEVFTMDDLITNAMIYIMTDSFPSGALYYHAMVQERSATGIFAPRCRVPTAYAGFPGDALMPMPPRSRAEAIYNISRWTEMSRGGHFAALQEPDIFANDIGEWGRALGPLG